MGDCLEKSCGTYVGVNFNKESVNRIRELTDLLNIPNVVPRDKLHSTVIYSRTKLNIPYGSQDVDYIGWTRNLEIWEDNGKNILVLKLESPSLERRHEELLNAGGTSDYPEYNPHITLSYDIGDYKIPDTIWVGFVLETIEEYAEELIIDWK